ncbi:unnamed protein product [Amoebophrya sp. A25]|nr:unnamed protein product [Amoebophrya sp. A25]|eukprot:GSA25T00002360001.1
MMKRVFGVAAMSAVALADKAKSSSAVQPGSGPLITAVGTFEFISSSVTVTKDLVVFGALTAKDVVMQKLPPKVQGQIEEKLDLVAEKASLGYAQAETLRLQNGIPPLSEIASTTWTRMQPVLKVIEASPPFQHTKGFVGSFEKAYPQHKGVLSGLGFLDLVLAAMFLGYIVLGYMLKMFCYVFCCGCCAKRKRSSSSPVELKKKPVTQDKKRK